LSRAGAKHVRLIHWKWFRVYYSGSYAWLEVDFGKVGQHELAVYIGCVDCSITCKYYNN
jgi:hypothetical protein